jgi:hypothetical protein
MPQHKLQNPDVLGSSVEEVQISFIQGHLYFQVGYCLANRAVQVIGDIINGVGVVAFIIFGGF